MYILLEIIDSKSIKREIFVCLVKQYMNYMIFAFARKFPGFYLKNSLVLIFYIFL